MEQYANDKTPQKPWFGGKRQRPPEAETLLAFGRLMEAANLLAF